MAYGQLDIELIFDEIWEFWLNKEGEHAAKKAVSVFLKSGNPHKELIESCKIYTYENETSDNDFTYKLANFINGDHWKDYKDGLKKLEEERLLAIEIINQWNSSCRSHWIQCKDVEVRIPIVKKALKDKFFKNNWKKSLDKASLIFKYPIKVGDPREKIILSLKWFTDVSNNKHTVLRIYEGELGSGVREAVQTKVKTVKKITDEERTEQVRLFQEVFGKRKADAEILENPSSEDEQDKDPYGFH